MNNLLILGAGGHGQVVAEIALMTERWAKIAWLDDNASALRRVPLPILGPMGDLALYRSQYDTVMVAIGDPKLRLQYLAQSQALGFNRAVLQHPTAVISRYATIAPGTVILEQAVIKAGADIGEGAIINTQAVIGHDCQLAEGVHVGLQAALSGYVQVGARAWLGTRAAILPNLSIGADATVGAGAVVCRSVLPHTVVAGVPAKVLEPRDKHAT